MRLNINISALPGKSFGDAKILELLKSSDILALVANLYPSIPLPIQSSYLRTYSPE